MDASLLFQATLNNESLKAKIAVYTKFHGRVIAYMFNARACNDVKGWKFNHLTDCSGAVSTNESGRLLMCLSDESVQSHSNLQNVLGR